MGIVAQPKPIVRFLQLGNPRRLGQELDTGIVCRLEQESIESIAGDHPVITVALQSGNAAEVAAHLHARDLRVPVLNDPDGLIAGAWGVRAVPATFVVRDGVIRYRERGFTTEAGLRLRLWLARVMD